MENKHRLNIMMELLEMQTCYKLNQIIVKKELERIRVYSVTGIKLGCFYHADLCALVDLVGLNQYIGYDEKTQQVFMNIF